MGIRVHARVVLSAAHGVNHFYQLLLPVAVWRIAEEFSLSHFLIGSLIFTYTISYALLQIPFGYARALNIHEKAFWFLDWFCHKSLIA